MHGRYLVGRGAAADVLKSVEEAVQRARESGDPSLHLNALGALAYTHLNLGLLRPALAASDQALKLFESAPRAIDAEAAAMMFFIRGTLLMIAGQLAPAAESIRRAEQTTPGLPRGLSLLAHCRGEIQLASSLAARELDTAERTGNQFFVASAHWALGDAQNAAGAYATLCTLRTGAGVGVASTRHTPRRPGAWPSSGSEITSRRSSQHGAP
jgi:tetratricopeptide (TPR) repeat protein